MLPEIPAPPANEPPPTEAKTKPPGVVLLENLLEEQIATNKLLAQLLTIATSSRQCVHDLRGWTLLILIVLVIGGVGVTTIVEHYRADRAADLANPHLPSHRIKPPSTSGAPASPLQSHGRFRPHVSLFRHAQHVQHNGDHGAVPLR